MKKALYLFFLSVCFSGWAQSAFAQIDPKKNDAVPKKELPKLDKVEMGPVLGVGGNATSKESAEPHISDIEAQNRSDSDGKISKTEMRIIDRARRLPQNE